MKTNKRIKRIVAIAVVMLLAAGSAGVLINNGRLWFVYPEYMGYTVKGVDVARYQGNIDWKKIAEQGFAFSFVKATEGSSYADPYFEKNIVSSAQNGLYTGAYHFFSAESAGATQAENFIRVVSPYQIHLPPVLDFEIAPENPDTEALVHEAQAFLAAVEAYYGVKPIIYTTYESYQAHLYEGFSDYPLWFRDLLKKPKIAGGADWVFWQYCNRGRVEGIDKSQKYTDLNVFNGNKEEFENYVQEIAAQMKMD